MDKLSIFKDKSVLWAVVLLIVVIFSLWYIKSTNPTGAQASFLGTYNNIGTPTNNIIIPAPGVIGLPTNNILGEEEYVYCNRCSYSTSSSGTTNKYCSQQKFKKSAYPNGCDNTCTTADDCPDKSSGGGSSGGGTAPDGGGSTDPGSGDNNGGGGTKPNGGGAYPGKSDNCSYCDSAGNCITKTRDNNYCTDYCSDGQNVCKKPIGGTGGGGYAPFVETPDIDIPSAPQPQGFWARLWRSILSFFARW